MGLRTVIITITCIALEFINDMHTHTHAYAHMLHKSIYNEHTHTWYLSYTAVVPAPGVSSVSVSHTTAEIVLMRPNGLCEGLSDNPITYMIEVFSDTVQITTRNVTSMGSATIYTIFDLTSMTMYTVNVRAVLNVVSQSLTAMFGFTTLGGRLCAVYTLYLSISSLVVY